MKGFFTLYRDVKGKNTLLVFLAFLLFSAISHHTNYVLRDGRAENTLVQQKAEEPNSISYKQALELAFPSYIEENYYYKERLYSSKNQVAFTFYSAAYNSVAQKERAMLGIFHLQEEPFSFIHS